MLGKIWGYLGMNEDGQSQEVADTAATINGDTNPTMVQLPTPMPQPKYQPESEEEEEETDDDFEPDPQPAKTGGITVIPTEKLNKEPEQTIAQQQAIPQDPEHRIISQQPQLHVQQMQQVQQPPPQQQQQEQPTVVQQPDLLQHQPAQMQQQIEQQQQPPQQQGLALAAKKSKVEIPAESEEEEEEEEEEETDDEEISPTQSQTINEPPRVPGFVLQHAVKSEANEPKNVTQAEIKPADNEKKNGLDIKIENKHSTELQQQSNYQSVGAQQEYQQPSIVESQTNLETEQQKQQLQQEQQNQQPKHQQEKQSKPTNFIQELRQRQHSPVNEIQAVEPERNTKEEQVRAEEEKLKHQERVEQTRRKQEETKSKQINIAQEAQRRQQEKQQQKQQQQQTQRPPATQAPPPVQQKSIPKFRQAEQERIEKQKQAEQQQQPLESQQRQQQSQSKHTSQKSIAPTEDDDEMNPYEKQNIAVRSAEAAVKSGALQPSVAANVPPSLEQRKRFQKPDQTKPQQQQQQSNQPQQQTEQPPPNQQQQRQPHHQQQSQQKVVPPPAQPKAETVPKFRQTNQNVAEKQQQQHQQQQEQMQAKQQAVQSFGSSKLSTGIIKENDDGRVSYAADKIPVPIAPPVPTHHSIQEFTPRFEAEAEMSSRTGRTGEHFSRLGSNYVASLKDDWREAIDAANREPGGPLDTAPAVKLQEFVPHSEGQNRGSADIGVGGSASSTSALFATAGVVSKVAPIWPPPEQENAHPKISNKFGFGPRQGGAMQDETSWMHGDDLGGRGGNAPWANPTKKPTLRRVTENVWPPPPSELGPRPEYVPEHIPEEEAWNPAGTTHVQRSKPVPPPVEQRAPKQWPPTNGTV